MIVKLAGTGELCPSTVDFSESDLPEAFAGVSSMIVDDLNGDGHEDLVASFVGSIESNGLLNESEQGVLVLWNTGSGFSGGNHFVLRIPGPPFIGDVKAMQADLDPELEILGSAWGAPSKSGLYLSQLDPESLMFQAPELILPRPNTPAAIAVGDLDGDGLMDAVVSDGSHLNAVFGVDEAESVAHSP